MSLGFDKLTTFLGPFPIVETSRGMTITTGSVVLEKDGSNLIGISIGGGAPYCPCLYIVQVKLVPVRVELSCSARFLF